MIRGTVAPEGFAIQIDIDDPACRIFDIPEGIYTIEIWLNSYTRFAPFLDFNVLPGKVVFNDKVLSYTARDENTPFMVGDSITIVGYTKELQKPTVYWADPVSDRSELTVPPDGTTLAYAMDIIRSVPGKLYVWMYKDGVWSEESCQYTV